MSFFYIILLSCTLLKCTVFSYAVSFPLLYSLLVLFLYFYFIFGFVSLKLHFKELGYLELSLQLCCYRLSTFRHSVTFFSYFASICNICCHFNCELNVFSVFFSSIEATSGLAFCLAVVASWRGETCSSAAINLFFINIESTTSVLLFLFCESALSSQNLSRSWQIAARTEPGYVGGFFLLEGSFSSELSPHAYSVWGTSVKSKTQYRY